MIKTNHFVYKTINLVNGKFYIGKHSTNNLNDSYLGSGKTIIKALNKYGKENFKREILYSCTSSDEAFLLEEEILTDEVLKDPMCYNIDTGGKGADPQLASIRSKARWANPEYKSKMKTSLNKSWESKERRLKQSKVMLKVCSTEDFKNKKSKESRARWDSTEFRNRMGIVHNSEDYSDKMSDNAQKLWTEDTKENHSKLMKESTRVEKNGKIIRILKNEVLNYTADGWMEYVQYD